MSSKEYAIAEALTVNKDIIMHSLRVHYIKAQTMTMKDASEYIEESVKWALNNVIGVSELDVDDAFLDDGVRTVLHVLYLKEFYYEH